MTLSSSYLAEVIQNQLDLYFTNFHEAELGKKIVEMIATIEQMIPEIIKIDPSQKDEFDKWAQNPTILENSLCQREKLKQKSVSKTDIIDHLMFALKAVLADRDELFLNKEISMTNWNINKDYLNNKMKCLKNEECQRLLMCEEIITFLNLMPINQCTSELGYFKEFARGINEKRQIFTKIFYLLKSNEKSYFHKLDTMETWTWLGKNPVSLFILENGQLNEHVLDESNQNFIIPSQTWFSAMIKNGEKHNFVENEIPFTLVTCHCIPAFTPDRYHDDIIGDGEASASLINAYKKATSEMQANIIQLVAPEYQSEFKQRASQ